MAIFAMILFLCATIISCEKSGKIHPLSDEFIDAINIHRSTWRAKRNVHPDTPIGRIKKFGGSLLAALPDDEDYDDDDHDDEYEDDDIGSGNDDNVEKPSYYTERYVNYVRDIPILHQEAIDPIPNSFSAIEKWTHCHSIGQIRDQSTCGSCWAFAIAEMVTDRICIHSDGASNPEISAEDLLTCCYHCYRFNGCDGGWVNEALQYWVSEGISTGGGYGTKKGCKSYSFKSCEEDYVKKNRTRPLCSLDDIYAHSCTKFCDDGVTDEYRRTLHFGEKIYRVANEVEQIQVEILKNGPVLAAFMIHEDFLHYHHGIYRHLMGQKVGYHAVKILGWGEEDGNPYWLVANSYNEEWGEKGFFRILRGTNECGIETFVYGGIPKMNIDASRYQSLQ